MREWRTRAFLDQVAASAAHQYPYACIVGCMDSRTPPELIFDQGVGDIFSIRVAGNVIGTEVIGSCEFAAKVAGVRLILVMGHTRCGAVTAACNAEKLGNLTGTLNKIKPAINAVKRDRAVVNSGNQSFVDDVAAQHVKLSLRVLTKKSMILRELSAKNEIAIAGAMYDLNTGVVRFF